MEAIVREVTLTRPIPRQGNPKRRIPNAKFHTTNGILEYDNSGAFSATVDSVSKNSYTYTFSSIETGGPESEVGLALALEDGEFIIPVYDDPKYVTVTLKNGTPLPSNFLSVIWEGNLRKRI